MKAFKYVLVYLLLIQLSLPYLVPFDLIFKDRMDYNLVKDNLDSIDVILEQISRQIRQENVHDYVIILGDSIAYSGPGDASQSIGHYLQEMAAQSSTTKTVRFYNLAMPAMQTGDIYTMLLKLDQHHISTENLIINVDYKGFVKRQPGPPIVFWLKEDLQTLDRDSYNHLTPYLQSANQSTQVNVQAEVHRLLWEHLQMLRYSGFIKKGLIMTGRKMVGAKPLDDALGDARPWFEKVGLKEVLQQDEYQQEFADMDFDMSSNNPQIFCLDRIIAHQQGQHTLIFLAAANPELMSAKVSTPGYIYNLQQIDNYLAAQPLPFVDLNGKIDAALFSDHMHLTAAGYQELAKLLWNKFALGDS
jgi:hypothetical protein